MIVRLFLAGQASVHEYAFDRAEALIGSSRRTDIHVPLPEVSLRHAVLRREQTSVWLEALKPGTQLLVERRDGGLIRATGPVVLEPGDVIHLGVAPHTATVELVAHTDIRQTSELTALFDIDAGSAEPDLTTARGLTNFALDLGAATRRTDIKAALATVLQVITQSQHVICGLQRLGTAERIPIQLIDEELASVLALPSSLKWRTELLDQLLNGRVVEAKAENGNFVIMAPLSRVHEQRGFWSVLVPELGMSDSLRDTLETCATTISQLLTQALVRLDILETLTEKVEENRYFRTRERRHYLYKELVTESPAMRVVYDCVSRWVDHADPVLILGEKGTGKEMVARALHHLSDRSAALMTSQNCAALSDDLLDAELFGQSGWRDEKFGPGPPIGLLELTRGGTLFLESVEHLSPKLQTKLSRAIAEREVRRGGDSFGRSIDVRIVVSSEIDLKQLVSSGHFRHDLYLQLAGCSITLPPLRDRRKDIVPLANVFLIQLAPRYGKNARRIAESLYEALESHPWKGNVRELQGSVEAAVIAVPVDAEEIEYIPWLSLGES